MAQARKRKQLTLEERVRVVERSEKGETAIAIAASVDVGKTQIQTIIREKESIRRGWECGESGHGNFSKMRLTTTSGIDEKLWDWFCETRVRHITVTGNLIQEKALTIAVECGCNE